MQRDEQQASPPVVLATRTALGRRVFGPLKAIGWAFLGIRGSDARQRDAVQVSPLVWVGTGVAAVVVFVVVLMALVHWLVPAVG